MGVLTDPFEMGFKLVRERRYADLARKLGSLAYERRIAVGLRRDLMGPSPSIKAKIPITVREFQGSDLTALLPESTHAMSRSERLEIEGRRRLHDASIPRCFVAVDDATGHPCYFQWLIGPKDNDRIQSFFPRGLFPILNSGTALLEAAYTPPHYRGKGIMPEAMARIAEHGRDIGCRSIVTFVEVHNVASIKGCTRAGFVPYIKRTEHNLALRLKRRWSFEPLPKGLGTV
ncbi:GNAT family N-acetyltransferase [Fulvimarina sp. 2208YS6-2-32]|uniref:GNAT family N-acetyltransferase n=1 Tax=Fulvimarina uroteuthidis TaxID=3098149 RepID=A0ABU5I1V7_9HYPH|nr:GNAT family N-acetyltransferase [Fulvimarina sp. 2208YS6-2-32]MDY8108804.1 GNAT family N-acetyltransferase [Fulvimarina sp. 2208YS6-2-32]